MPSVPALPPLAMRPGAAMSRPCLFLLVLCLARLGAGEVATPHPLGSTPAPYGYLEYLPPSYQAKGRQRHPLVFFLHGLGELGDSTTELPKVGHYGPLKHLAQNDQIAKQ